MIHAIFADTPDPALIDAERATCCSAIHNSNEREVMILRLRESKS
jgi:hypothetical protein